MKSWDRVCWQLSSLGILEIMRRRRGRRSLKSGRESAIKRSYMCDHTCIKHRLTTMFSYLLLTAENVEEVWVQRQLGSFQVPGPSWSPFFCNVILSCDGWDVSVSRIKEDGMVLTLKLVCSGRSITLRKLLSWQPGNFQSFHVPNDMKLNCYLYMKAGAERE